MKNSGLWVCVDDAPGSLAATIRNGAIRVFQPTGAYEATSQTNAEVEASACTPGTSQR